ncbi:MAG TPA: endonuclease MutS2, partial [Treponema sp.]|nr:endonuclease MutS2 [Treponema sp.]
VEPEDVVEKNNDILMEERRLQAEVARVLREMTARIGEKAAELADLSKRTIILDGLCARARYSFETRGAFADSASGKLELRKARHPMLGSKAVPIDIAMDAATRIVIVTGPNTGGKTVALKTVGLFALMNQFALALPAEEGTALPVFDGVYADIGDEQSISQSLSTFSAHMTNISSIVASATDRSLVLLDELGSGTDPEEGSAIAMSLLDHFIAVRARLLATTHHGILKNYGYSKEGVVNASVDFDAATLSPTYRILMGVPGESRALDIASRNGLDLSIVDRARGYLDEERADVSALIIGLKTKHRELQDEAEARRKEEVLLREDRRRIDLRELRLRQKESELKEQGIGSLRRLLNESRKTLENLVRELREGEMTREKTLKVKDFIAGFEKSIMDEDARFEAEAESLDADLGALREAAATEEREGRAHASSGSGGKRNKTRGGEGGGEPEIPLRIEPGIDVFAGPSRRRGKVLRAGKRGFWDVEIGALRMTLPERELIPTSSAEPVRRVEIMQADLAGTTSASLELNLRGMRLEEALEALRRQLDAASLTGLYDFSVIHGKGDGILQRGVHDYLKSHPGVADYHFSRPEEGGYGKTVVALKR